MFQNVQIDNKSLLNNDGFQAGHWRPSWFLALDNLET